MEPLLTIAEMRERDRLATEKFGIPGIVLMENAGRGVAEAIEREFGSLVGKTILIFCGKGNNGGDGFAAARHLLNRGGHITLVLVGKSVQVSGDAGINLKIIQRLLKKNGEEKLDFIEFKSLPQLSRLKKPDIIVDALFGTGFSGDVKTPYKEVIQWLNNAGTPIVAVDIPSGINAESGEIVGVAVRAQLTVTMGLKKIGLMVGKGYEHAGKVTVEDIGVPDTIFKSQKFQNFLIQRSDVRRVLPRRSFDAHKHSVGKFLFLQDPVVLPGPQRW